MGSLLFLLTWRKGAPAYVCDSGPLRNLNFPTMSCFQILLSPHLPRLNLQWGQTLFYACLSGFSLLNPLLDTSASLLSLFHLSTWSSDFHSFASHSPGPSSTWSLLKNSSTQKITSKTKDWVRQRHGEQQKPTQHKKSNQKQRIGKGKRHGDRSKLTWYRKINQKQRFEKDKAHEEQSKLTRYKKKWPKTRIWESREAWRAIETNTI